MLMAMYSMRSEREFCERLNYDMLFKWSLGLPIDAAPGIWQGLQSSQDRQPRPQIVDRHSHNQVFSTLLAVMTGDVVPER
jgi:hypothetical protein